MAGFLLNLRFAKTPTTFEINDIASAVYTCVLLQVFGMFRFPWICFGALVRFFCSRQSLLLDNLELRQ
jgi:hypothetical protein